jgi:WD40-like Beta Propeller Repeat
MVSLLVIVCSAQRVDPRSTHAGRAMIGTLWLLPETPESPVALIEALKSLTVRPPAAGYHEGGVEMDVPSDVRRATAAVVRRDGRTSRSCLCLIRTVNVWSVPLQPNSGRVTGPPQRVTATAALQMSPSASDDGRRLVFSAEKPAPGSLWIKASMRIVRLSSFHQSVGSGHHGRRFAGGFRLRHSGKA